MATYRPAEIKKLLQGISSDKIGLRQITIADRVRMLSRLAAIGGIDSMEYILPLFLQLDGKAYKLTDYQPFGPLFRLLMPESQVWVTGRQTSKSTSIASRGVMQCVALPYFKILYLTPLYEQIRRFSHNYVRRFINESPVKSLMLGTSTQNSVLQRTFSNHAMMQFSFALTDADRVRGISTHSVSIDEYQDMSTDLLPIILETMSASPWSLVSMTGTPKSLDTPLQGAWEHSSQAEWFIRCRTGGCNEWNIPSKEYHILKMIGPMHDNISVETPAVVCHKCQRPIDPMTGHWVHAKKELRWQNAGYHVPQIILPLHYADPKRWAQLLRKQQGWNNTTESQFWNEVLGVSVDTGQKLVTETELKNASCLPWKNNPKSPDPKSIEVIPEYTMRVLAVDWGGGGETAVSFTVLSVMGITPSGEIHVLWAKRLLMAADHAAEAREVLHYFKLFSCNFVAHDYTGAGGIREVVLAQAGLSIDKLIPIRLAAAAVQDLMTYHEPTMMNHRAWFSLDKTRSLLFTCQAIKTRLLKFFQYDRIDKDEPGLIGDFLALIEAKIETRNAGDIYSITRNPANSDDFAQACNLGACSLWHLSGNWPNFAAAAAHAKLTPAQEKVVTDTWDDYQDDDRGGYNPNPY